MALAGNIQTYYFSETSGTELIAAVTGKSIRILALVISQTAKVVVTLQDDAGSPKVLMNFDDITAPLVVPFSEAGWGQTASGQALDIGVGGVSTVTGTLVYAEV